MRCFPAIFFALVLGLTSCSLSSSRDTEPINTTKGSPEQTSNDSIHPYATMVESGHHANKLRGHEVLQYNMVLSFRGTERLRGSWHQHTGTGWGRFDRSDGSTLWFDGDKVWVHPAKADWSGARFDAYTWPYFQALPYKLADPGTVLKSLPEENMHGRLLDVAELTFSRGTGDAPDDWYRLYTDRESGLLQAAAYIVTYGDKDRAEAEVDPHAIFYSDYRDVAGVPMAHTWTFVAWQEGPSGQGLWGDTLGHAQLSDFQLRTASGEEQAVPDDALDVAAP